MTYNKYDEDEYTSTAGEIIPKRRKEDWYVCEMTGIGEVCTEEKNIMKLEEQGYEIIEIYYIAKANQ